MKYLKTYEAIVAKDRIKDDIWLSNKKIRTIDSLYPYEQEILNLFKFKIGDYVKFGDNIYKIMAVNTDGIKSDKFQSEYRYYLYDLVNNNSYGSWVIEPNLELAEDWELDAMKYNL